MDWRIVGDRRSGCRAAMRPVGLTTKHRHNKYASACDGELMLLHQCSRCAKIVINRIAADDDLVALFAVFEDSCASEVFQTEAIRAGIAILTAANRELVRLRLLGHTQVDRSHVWRETQRV